MTATQRTEITPLDQDSPRGQELAADLTLLLDDIEDDIERRKAEAAQPPSPERGAA